MDPRSDPLRENKLDDLDADCKEDKCNQKTRQFFLFPLFSNIILGCISGYKNKGLHMKNIDPVIQGSGELPHRGCRHKKMSQYYKKNQNEL